MARYSIKLDNKGRCRLTQLFEVMDAQVLAVEICECPKTDKSPQGRRTLSLLVENCGRVHLGRDLDKQHKGDRQTKGSPLLCLLLTQSSAQSVVYKSIFICIFTGLVGDILLNNIPLRDFTIYSLDMNPSFIDRFVCFTDLKALHMAFFSL